MLKAAARTPDFSVRLARSLGDQNNPERHWFAWAAGEIGDAANLPEIVDVLIALIYSPDSRLGHISAWAFAKIALASGPTSWMHILEKLQCEPDVKLHTPAFWALSTIRGYDMHSVALVADVLESLCDNDVFIQHDGAVVLGKIGPSVAENPAAISRLLELLDSPTPMVGIAATIALGRIGKVLKTVTTCAADSGSSRNRIGGFHLPPTGRSRYWVS